MIKFKKNISILLTLCFVIAMTSCGENTPQEVTPEETTLTVGSETENDIEILQLNKEYISHYEWYEDYPTMLVRSEYTDVTLDKSLEKKYSLLANALSETSIMRKRTMEEEKDNLLSFATEEFMNDGEAFSTRVSTLDVKVRRADSVAVSLLEDYATESSRSFSGYNYDTESGKLLTLSDVVKDTSKLPEAAEKTLMTRIGEEEPFGETAVRDYFKNVSEEDISWTLDYNGITLYFNPGAVAPTNFGNQTITLTFAEYPGLFKEKYASVPEAYTVSLPLSVPFFTDITGDMKTDEFTVSGDYDSDGRNYTTMAVSTDKSEYEDEWFSYGLDPYYVKTADGNSYLYIFSLNSEDETRESTLSVFELKNGEAELLGTSEIGLANKGNKVFALPTDPENILLDTYNGTTDSVFSADDNGIPMKTVNVSSAEEFLNAVSSNTEIIIKNGYYNMSYYVESKSQNFTHKFVSFDDCFDGNEIFVENISFLKISGGTEKFSDTELVVTPRYAAVLNFENCNNVEFSNLTVGHVEAGECSGNVLNFSACSDITINNCDLYGCGVYGIGADNGTGNVYVNNSTIRDCSQGPMNIVGAKGVYEFSDCILKDSDSFGCFEKTDDCSLTFRNCTFGYWETSYFMFLEDITAENCTWSEDYIYPEYGY